MVAFFQDLGSDGYLAPGSLWRLDELVNYLAAFQANRGQQTDRAQYGDASFLRNRIAGMLRRGIFSGALRLHDTHYLYAADDAEACAIDFARSTLDARDFLRWARAEGVDVPEQFVRDAESRVYDRPGSYEVLKVKSNTIHHERCRAVAEMIWSLLPQLTINDMSRRPEIVKFGCEGHTYDPRTIARWLATLKDNRKPGRHAVDGSRPPLSLEEAICR